ncbi:hypothetical protein M9H77_01477 [Catharanthus roseus]|uniref:Uncharacterized protein n=1 Tax=Catharanthus roseus TaxID=4058 RepID=A0ACC0C5S9_CATRO|nr:hypothetical protein M9H77_01477 [Catharanthus roseus]
MAFQFFFLVELFLGFQVDMDHSEDFAEENIVFENNVDPNTFEEFLELEEYVDHGHLFATDRILNSKVELENWAKETAIKVNTVTRYLSSRTSDHRPYIILGCEHGGANKSKTKPRVDDEEEEVQVKRHNHAVGLYNYGHAQAVKLTEEKLIQTEPFRKSHVPPRNILQFFRERNVSCTVSAQKIYNIVAKIKKDRMQRRNTIEEVLCLSAQRGYMVFYKNCDDSNVLSDIVVAHLISIQILRMWPYVHIDHMMYVVAEKIHKSRKESTQWGGQQRPPPLDQTVGKRHPLSDPVVKQQPASPGQTLEL